MNDRWMEGFMLYRSLHGKSVATSQSIFQRLNPLLTYDHDEDQPVHALHDLKVELVLPELWQVERAGGGAVRAAAGGLAGLAGQVGRRQLAFHRHRVVVRQPGLRLRVGTATIVS